MGEMRDFFEKVKNYEGTNIAIYSVSGQAVGSTKASGNEATLATNIKKGEVVIIKIGDKSVKVVMK